MFKFFKNIFSKNKNNNMDTERLINLKENFTGQKFQWVKTRDENLLGKVVKCKDIQPKGRSFIAMFNDGSSIPTDKLNRNLMMITEGMHPLSKSEVRSIAGPPIPKNTSTSNETLKEGPTGSGPIQMPDDLKQFQTPPSQKITEPAKDIPRENPFIKTKPVHATNMFSMFNTDEINLNIAVSLKLPNKKLLKMMYENADNKETFLSDLSQYVYSKINNDIVKNSLEKILVPANKKTKSQTKTEIVITEVNEK